MGPDGMGPMTGRGAGYCAGFAVPGYMNNAGGRGAGAGFGRRPGFFGGGGRSFGAVRGRRFGFQAAAAPGFAGYGVNQAAGGIAPDPEAARQLLKNQAASLQEELELVRQRLADLEQETE